MILNKAKSNQSPSNIDIDVYGGIGAGKTQLAAAVFRHVNRSNVSVSSSFELQLNRAADGIPATRTKSNEVFSITVDNRKMNFNVYVGECVQVGNEREARPLVTTYTRARSRVFVAVVNPFIVDRGIAFQAACSMISWLQRWDLTFQNAIRLTFEILFHRGYFSQSETLKNALLSDEFVKAKIVYNSNARDQAERFSVTESYNSNANGAPIMTTRLGEALELAVFSAVDRASATHSVLSDVLQDVDNSILVLSHLDLIQYMSGFDIGQIRQVCDIIYRNRSRRESRQLFGRYVVTSFNRGPVSYSGDRNEYPVYENGKIDYRSDIAGFPNLLINNIITLTDEFNNKLNFCSELRKTTKLINIMYFVGFAGIIWSLYTTLRNEWAIIPAAACLLTLFVAVRVKRIIKLTERMLLPQGDI